ncbi:heme utilization protein HutZ [Vibrio algarum]|uniref:Heme utilization protein HutZ n=1 Tax=Vibrio algarum TaxID=3020714 RepID=A0ABT4YS74_9VIBR|nr:heme utilization protein HutZ [Vibrio sp. KJ40-1]MDB1124418.1 heme utilization protein HutZ [Vibrio sp. KJ40-1]
MENKQQRIQNRIGSEIVEFRQQQKTLQMATLTYDGCPHVSYTPFVYLPDGYYILISDIAKHGQNIKSHQKVSIMMIEDEQDSRSIYARKRLSFDTTANLVHRESDSWWEAIRALEQRFGEIVSNLSKLGDFHMYQLIPEKGRFVKGFGKAFDVTGSDLVDIVHLDEGHIKNK